MTVAGCSHGGGGPVPLVLDGSPRVPDDQGVVTAVSQTSITLDSSRTYTVTHGTDVFSTATLQPLSLLGRRAEYVQLRLHHKTVEWIASFSAVVTLPGRPPTAYYLGTFSRVESHGRAVFIDGTVLVLAPGVTAPKVEERVRADIDTTSHTVRVLTPI